MKIVTAWAYYINLRDIDELLASAVFARFKGEGGSQFLFTYIDNHESCHASRELPS